MSWSCDQFDAGAGQNWARLQPSGDGPVRLFQALARDAFAVSTLKAVGPLLAPSLQRSRSSFSESLTGGLLRRYGWMILRSAVNIQKDMNGRHLILDIFSHRMPPSTTDLAKICVSATWILSGGARCPSLMSAGTGFTGGDEYAHR